MPYLRFNRDKRGYENTFVVHSPRRRGKGRSRILYWFRTPPGVRVGRAALDEDAIRLIEEHNPQIHFDWTRILKGQGEEDEPVESASRKAPRPARSSGEQAASRPGPLPVPIAASAEEDSVLQHDLAGGESELDEPSFAAAPDAMAGTAEMVILAGSTERPSPAEARLGSEGLQRLRGRYADILAGINDRIPEGPRREELKAQAERLNPDSWVTEEEVRLGLEQYESVFESLRPMASRRRRRRRRRPGNPL